MRYVTATLLDARARLSLAGAWISAVLLLLVRLWRTVWYANVSPNMYRIRAAANCAFRASQLIRIALITP
jgi:hypothetical protein